MMEFLLAIWFILLCAIVVLLPRYLRDEIMEHKHKANATRRSYIGRAAHLLDDGSSRNTYVAQAAV